MKYWLGVLCVMGLFLMGQEQGCSQDMDGDGWTTDEDCDDTNADIHPGAEEACDGLDNDCDGEVDEDQCGTDYIGNYDLLPSESSHAADYLLGVSFDVEDTVTLTGVGLIGISSGQGVKVGVYESNSEGYPTNLIAESGAFTLEADRMELDVEAVTLDPGPYWFMAIYSSTASIGFTNEASDRLTRYVSMSYSSDLPTTWSSSDSSYYGQDFNYYFIVNY